MAHPTFAQVVRIKLIYILRLQNSTHKYIYLHIVQKLAYIYILKCIYIYTYMYLTLESHLVLKKVFIGFEVLDVFGRHVFSWRNAHS